MQGDTESPQTTAPLEGSRTGDAATRYGRPEDSAWLARARDAYRASDDWFSSSLRKQAEGNISHFRSQHKPGSKYNSELYMKKSRVFRPKTRSMVRRSDAAMAIAYFSTQDTVNVTAVNESRPEQRVAALTHHALLNYRLENDIPWFLICVGGSQDAVVQGVVISKQAWERKVRTQRVAEMYEEPDGSTTIEMKTEEVVTSSKPTITLIALENLRIDPAADWTDPINKSPYCIELCPVYIYELLEGMKRTNPRTGKPDYRRYDAGMLQACLQQDWDSVRQMREGNRVDKYQNDIAIDEYRVVWVHKSHYRVDGEDWYVETLGTELLLTEPELAAEVFPHLEGKERPYSMGYASIEAHVAYPQGPVEMAGGLQEEINDIANLRLDNVKLALNRRWFVRRGMGVDVPTLIRNVPSSVVFMTDTEKDVRDVNTPDVTRSSYEENDRLTIEMDELVGNFSAASVGSNRQLNETVGGMNMLAGDASQIQEFQIRTVSETWVERVMRHLVRLEATYETDDEILDVVVANTGLPMELIKQNLHHPTCVRTNVGFSATQPEKRIGKLMFAMDALGKVLASPMAAEIDRAEVAKEIFGAVGYRDGSRFMPNIANNGKEDPRIKQLQDTIAQLQQVIQMKQVEQQGKLEVAKIGADAMLQKANLDNNVKYELAAIQGRIEVSRMKLEQVDRILEGEKEDTKRKELMLQREALSHSISSDNREFLLKVQQAATDQQQADREGAMNLAGNDKAGVISRGNYGEIPNNRA